MLRAGRLVAFPTETVYGLGADATNDAAVARIFAAKGRPRFNPLIAHYPSKAAMTLDVVLNAWAEQLIERFLPGPLTLVLQRKEDCRLSLLCSAGLDSQAVRLPAHPIARRLLETVDRPLAAPSANRSGQVSPTSAAHVAKSLSGAVDLILDGGPCEIGLESSVVDLTGKRPALLRPGAITREMLEAELGPLADPEGGIKSPGQMESHYAPSKALRLNARSCRPGEGLLAFGTPLPGPQALFNLSPTEDLSEAAANLFKGLHSLDALMEIATIAVMPIPDEGLGEAINDRLRRAAAPRGSAVPGNETGEHIA